MKQIQLTHTGPVSESNLQEIQIPLPIPQEGEVLVRVDACGVCYRDIIDREGGNSMISPPISLGHEIAGTVHTSMSSG